jgi:hypothetical protein
LIPFVPDVANQDLSYQKTKPPEYRVLTPNSTETMASFYLQCSSASASESADGADWMADMQGEGRDVSKAAPVASVAAVVLGPVVKPAPVSWMTPKISSSETGSDSTPLKRQKSADTFPVEKQQRKRADWDRNAALSAAAAQKSAAASEAAVRLASMAVKQMLQTKEVTTAAAKGLATPKAKRMKAAMAATSSVAGQSADSPQSTEKGVNPEHEVRPEETGEEVADAEESPEADVAESAEGVKGSRGEVGTFAGNRPPKDPDALELFNYKKDMYHAARSELEKKYPGKVLTLGRTSSQLGWWAHLRDHMLLAKGPDHKKKRNSMSKEETKDAIAAAAKTWKAKVSKLAVARGGEAK